MTDKSHSHAANVKAGHGPATLDTWGTKDHLTPPQQDALTQFLQQVPNTSLDGAKFNVETYENVALRFLRARNFQVPNAIQLLNDCLKKKADGRAAYYAAASHPDECTQCDTAALQKFYPHTQLGYDRFNRPILFEHSGGVDGDAIRQMTSTENLIHYHWYSMETTLNQMFEVAAQKGPSIISTCVVLDLTGLSSHHMSSKVLDHVKALVALDNICYPEILGKMLVINAPWLAVTIWEMAKGWLDIRTQQKIEILGSGPETTQRLLQFISPENLPQIYGGAAANPFHPRENTEFVHIPRSGLIKKQIAVPSHQKLIVESYVTDGDIGFEVYHRKVAPNAQTQGRRLSRPHPHPHESMIQSEWTRFLSAHGKEWKVLLKRELKNTNPSHDSHGAAIHRLPQRFIIDLPAHLPSEDVAAGHHHEYMLVWTNAAMLVTRPLVFNLLLKEHDASEPSGALPPPPSAATAAAPPASPAAPAAKPRLGFGSGFSMSSNSFLSSMSPMKGPKPSATSSSAAAVPPPPGKTSSLEEL